MNPGTRPAQAGLFSALLVLSSIFMALLGLNASAYYVPAACLLLQAVLIWRGTGFRWFKRIIEVNQVTSIVLILVLWLGEGLGVHKLDVTGVMLLVNLLTGGPMMSILAAPILGSVIFGKQLTAWFRAHGIKASGTANARSFGALR